MGELSLYWACPSEGCWQREGAKLFEVVTNTVTKNIFSKPEKKKASALAGLTLCFIWWAHTDSNRGPKDYESRLCETS